MNLAPHDSPVGSLSWQQHPLDCFSNTTLLAKAIKSYVVDTTTTTPTLIDAVHDPAEDQQHVVTFVLCPNTVFPIADLMNDWSSRENSMLPLLLRSDTTIQCGWDGLSTNQCVLTGDGILIAAYLPQLFGDGKRSTPLSNAAIKGITFEYPLSQGAMWLGDTGGAIRAANYSGNGGLQMVDCFFQRLTKPTIKDTEIDGENPRDPKQIEAIRGKVTDSVETFEDSINDFTDSDIPEIPVTLSNGTSSPNRIDTPSRPFIVTTNSIGKPAVTPAPVAAPALAPVVSISETLSSAPGISVPTNTPTANTFLNVLIPANNVTSDVPSKAPSAPESTTVVSVIKGEQDLAELYASIADSGIVGILIGNGPFTVFAPTNEAFAAANQDGFITKLKSPDWVAHLFALLSCHVHGGNVLSTNITDGMTISTFAQFVIPLETEITAFVNTEGSVSLSGVAFLNSNVVEADLAADNGVVHKVDKLLIPYSLTIDLFENAINYRSLLDMTALVVQADLEDTVRSQAITFFLPTANAFFSMPAATLDEITGDEQLLRRFVSNHLVQGIFPSAKLTEGLALTTLAMEIITIMDYKIGGVSIAAAEFLAASNGIGHTIEGFLFPPLQTVEVPTNAPTANTETNVPFLANNATSNVTTVVSVIEGEQDLAELYTSIADSGIVRILIGDGPFTVFAPTNEAFAAANQDGFITKLKSPDWVAHLLALLSSHVHGGNVLSSNITDGMTISTFAQLIIPLEKEITAFVNTEGGVSLSGVAFMSSSVVEADLAADNGVVHKVDKLLIPYSLTIDLFQNAINYRSLLDITALVVQADLEDTVRSQAITFFLPTAIAFYNMPAATLDEITGDEQLLRRFVSNHLVQGIFSGAKLTEGLALTTLATETITIMDYKIGGVSIAVAEFLVASNGIGHTIEGFLFPPLQTDEEMPPVVMPSAINLFEMAQEDASLSNMVSLIVLAGLEETVSFRNITIFLPTDDAFTNLSPETLSMITADNELLRQVVLNHIVKGLYTGARLTDGLELTTLADETVTIMNSTVGGVDIVDADLLVASNGVGHAMNGFLFPPMPSPSPIATGVPTGAPATSTVEESAPPVEDPSKIPTAAPLTEGFTCGLCMSNTSVSFPNAIVKIPSAFGDVGQIPCILLDAAVKSNPELFTEEACSELQLLYQVECGCVSVAPMPEYPQCSVCKPGTEISFPGAVVDVAPQGLLSSFNRAPCGVVDVAIKRSPNPITEEACNAIRQGYEEDCGCVAQILPEPSAQCSSICRPGTEISLPDVIVSVALQEPLKELFQGFSAASCSVINYALAINPDAINAENCSSIHTQYEVDCGCVPSTNPDLESSACSICKQGELITLPYAAVVIPANFLAKGGSLTTCGLLRERLATTIDALEEDVCSALRNFYGPICGCQRSDTMNMTMSNSNSRHVMFAVACGMVAAALFSLF